MRRKYTSLYQTAQIPLITVPLSYTESVWFTGPIRSGERRHETILPPPRTLPLLPSSHRALLATTVTSSATAAGVTFTPILSLSGEPDLRSGSTC